MDLWGIIFIVAMVALVIGIVIYFLNRWAGKRAATQQEMVEQHKQTVSLYVIDKKKDKITNANFPKAVREQMPRMSKLMKMPLVKVKVGTQIMTMLCEAAVFDALPVKKTVTVEVAGAYIVSMKGMKTKREMEQVRASRRKGEVAAPLKWHEKIRARFGRQKER